MKMLLPVDGSACSLRAVEFLIAHCACLRDVPEVHLLHVHAPIPIGRVQAHIGRETLLGYYREESLELLEAALQLLGAAGYVPTTHIHVGQPAEVISNVAADLSCELIVMGVHGRGSIASLVMGSVASRVLHLATCPLLLVK